MVITDNKDEPLNPSYTHKLQAIQSEVKHEAHDEYQRVPSHPPVIAECKSTPLAEGTLYFSVVSIDWIRLKIPEGSDDRLEQC